MLGNYNNFIITPAIKKEIDKHMEFQLERTKRICQNHKKFNYGDIKHVLMKRYEKIMHKYLLREEVKTDPEFINSIKEFYMEYLPSLEKILLEKIKGKDLSHKLKKLAQRESMLPEEGDITLLAEVYELKKKNDKIAILSDDKDLTMFSKVLKENWRIEVFSRTDYSQH